MCYFDGCFVGNRVWDKILGNGVIKSCDKDADDILVVFEDDKKYPTVVNFDYRGCIDCGYGIQRLQYYKSRDIVITQDDLDISADSGSYRLSSLGIDQITKEKSEFGAYGNSGCNFKDYNYSKYTRKVHREEPKLVPDDLDEEFVGDTSEPEPISEVTQALYDGYEIIKMEQVLMDR